MRMLVRNAYVITMDDNFSKFKGNILVEDDRIKKISKDEIKGEFDQVVEADGLVALPGFVQPHVHLCQMLFRGAADDMELLDWLGKRIWPLEGAHDEESIYWSAKLGLAELIKSGTTAIVDMESVHHTDHAIRAIYESGMRALTGKCMMDYGSQVPATLMEKTEDSIAESMALLNKWHMKDNGRIQYAFNPRFAVSCTEELLMKVGKLARENQVKVHTHASENRGEIEFVRQDRGMRNVDYFRKLGLLDENLILAHCIWLDQDEMEALAKSRTKIAHCPSSNLKLASGVAKIPELDEMGVDIGIASDGAPCNNSMDMFSEMKLASMIQKVRLGPEAMDCRKVLHMATMGGARVMGLEKEIGSLEEGKKADIILMDLKGMHNAPSFQVDVESTIVFSAQPGDVHSTIIDGRILMEDRKLKVLDEEEIIRKSNESIERLRNKVKMSE